MTELDWDQGKNKAWDQVWGYTSDQARIQVSDQVGDPVWGQVRDRVWVEMRSQITNQIWSQINDRAGETPLEGDRG